MRLFFIIAMIIGLPVAFAGESDGKTRAPASVTYEKRTKIDFEDRSVDGEFMTPDGQAVSADQNLHFDSMLDPKDNFKKEMKRSMGAVR
ncbi:MAG TPA: hypothetical protein VM901_04690 [Bdellovibrionota bacterium]|jgi:hypothetical protein|nr:hypothetical protein [Bdellovibrionota bacterium]